MTNCSPLSAKPGLEQTGAPSLLFPPSFPTPASTQETAFPPGGMGGPPRAVAFSLLCSEEVLTAERGGYQVEGSPPSSGSEAETCSLPPNLRSRLSFQLPLQLSIAMALSCGSVMSSPSGLAHQPPTPSPSPAKVGVPPPLSCPSSPIRSTDFGLH